MGDNRVEVEPSQCKGCELCIGSCPRGCLALGREINGLGCIYAVFSQKGCTACGLCYYVCPEPGAITVYKGDKP